MVTKLPLYVWVPTISFSPLTDSFKYVCLWFMIVSKQALSYIENKRCCFATQSVHRSKPFFVKKKDHRIVAVFALCRLAYFSLCCLAYFTAVKSQRSCMNIKVKELSSWYEFRPSVSVIITMSFVIFGHYFNICLDLGIFWSFLSHICKLWMHWRRVCLKSTRVPSDTTLRRSLVTIKPGLGHYFTWIMSISFNSMHFLLWTDCERSTLPGTWLSLNSLTFLMQIIPASHGKIFWPL